MIDEYYTFLIFGYHSDDWADGSAKQIVAVCEECGKYRTVEKKSYKDLCLQCSRNTNEYKQLMRTKSTGRIVSQDSRDKMSLSALNMSPEKRQKIIDAAPQMTPERLAKIVAANTGRIHSEEEKQKRANSNRGKVRTFESRRKMSATMQGIPMERWTGFAADNYINRNHNKNTIYMNGAFDGCNQHHITKTIVIHIPEELHRHVRHSLKTGYNMEKINMLALQFVNGGL